MKKITLCVFLVLMFCNSSLSQSLLPECEGNNIDVTKFTAEKFRKVRKWTNCHGFFTGPKGGTYEGEFFNGKFHGEGTFIKDGRKYVGQWKKHKKHGYGTYIYANGDKYVGEWISNKYFDNGTYIYANGDKYIGEWKKKKYNKPDNLTERHGQGIYLYMNGDKYIGEWRNGLKHGNGILTYLNGFVKEGVWKKDKLVKPK